MGLIELFKITLGWDEEIYIPMDSEYKCVNDEGICIWEFEESNVCEPENNNLQSIKKLVDNGLPDKPEGKAPKFILDTQEND